MTANPPLNRIVNVAEFPTPMIVTAVALVRSDGNVLVQRRRLTAEHGGLWEFPGGKVDPGETPDQAAVRELAEELDLLVERDELDPVAFTSGRTGDGRSGRPVVILLYAVCRWLGEPIAREAEELGWFAPKVMAKMPMPPLDYPLARQLERLLEKKAF